MLTLLDEHVTSFGLCALATFCSGSALNTLAIQNEPLQLTEMPEESRLIRVDFDIESLGFNSQSGRKVP